MVVTKAWISSEGSIPLHLCYVTIFVLFKSGLVTLSGLW